jgi:hypothetical protein
MIESAALVRPLRNYRRVVTRISATVTVLLLGLGGILQLRETAKELKAHRDRLFDLSYQSERGWRLARTPSRQQRARGEAEAADKTRLSSRQAAPLSKCLTPFWLLAFSAPPKF